MTVTAGGKSPYWKRSQKKKREMRSEINKWGKNQPENHWKGSFIVVVVIGDGVSLVFVGCSCCGCFFYFYGGYFCCRWCLCCFAVTAAVVVAVDGSGVWCVHSRACGDASEQGKEEVKREGEDERKKRKKAY